MDKKSLRHYLKALSPAYWVRNQSTSPAWDAELNRLIDAGEPFTEIGQCRATIGGHKVWVASHPHASFTLEPRDIGVSRSTVARAVEWLDWCDVNKGKND